MTNEIFGIDFGTTNSLASLVVGDRVLTLTDEETGRPHPSVIWYRGSDVVVGGEARKHLDLTEGGAPPGFVRSPKMALRRNGPIFVDGRPIDPTDAVAEVLKHLKADAGIGRERAPGNALKRAVMTIPVDFGGVERRALRQAARKADIGVVQFVHEPVAALYAYVRSQKDFKRELARLEGRFVLVFDWGGGTLDLTLCRILGGTIMQVASLGDNEVGGDRFDERLRNLIRSKHAATYGLQDVAEFEQPGMSAKLLNQSELVKISLSKLGVETEDVIIRNYLKTDGPSAHLVVSVSRSEVERECFGIISRGLGRIDEILTPAQLTYQDVELCLATGGMVKMPAILSGLTEKFLGRVPHLQNGDRIIAEGAAWIARDDLRLTLAKPIELLVADGSAAGTYYPLVAAGLDLPVENQIIAAASSRLFCVDPREGVAVMEIAKPIRLGAVAPNEPRQTLCVINVDVDANAPPLIERLKCDVTIDHDYVATARFSSSGLGQEVKSEFHNLDFGLRLPVGKSRTGPDAADGGRESGSKAATPSMRSNVLQRPNVAPGDDETATIEALWRVVPGDIVAKWQPKHFDNRLQAATKRQQEERDFYEPCARCGRTISAINIGGAIELCRGRPCERLFPRTKGLGPATPRAGL